MIFWIWAGVTLAALVLYLRQIYSRFSRHGVKHFTPLPFLGTMARVAFRIEHWGESVERSYRNFTEERFVGVYEFIQPMVVIRDLELLKKITVKDFEHFLDHRGFLDHDKLFGRNLFAMKGQTWKDMRSTLSPAFTSSKIRHMVPFMVEVGDQMTETLKKQIDSSADDYIDIDVKDLTTRYANDVIASCAFGLKVNSLTDRQNEFYLMGKEASSFSFLKILMFFILGSVPKLNKTLKVPLFTEASRNFFKKLVLNTMQDRELRHVIRPDMIHLLMEAKKGTLTHEDKTTTDANAGFATVEESFVGKNETIKVWTDDDLIAQAVLFFIAGFETVSSAMSFLLHELAVNPEVQEKLVKEIKENDARNGGKFDYNSIQQMTYLDMAVSESLRLWPPVTVSDRVCNKDYSLGKPNTNATEDYIVRKGEAIFIPVWAIHHSPEFYPEPYKFDPERFSENNSHKIKPFTYMPFGLGPRNCIASRFALCEVKVMVYQLLQNMELSPAAKTQIPAKLSTESFNPRIKGGHWARLKVRK